MNTHLLSHRSRRRHGFTFMEILFSVMILGIGFIMVAAMFPAALRQTQQNVEENEFNVLVRTGHNDLQNAAYATDFRYYNKYPTQSPPHLLDQLTKFVATDPAQPSDFDHGVSVQQASVVGRPKVYSFHDPRLAAAGAAGIPYSKTDASAEYNAAEIAPAMWDLVRGNMINPDDKAYAWVALWSRSKRGVAPTATAGNSLQLLIFPVRSRAKAQFDGQATLPNTSPAKPNPACDLTYQPANLDPVLVEVKYYPPTATTANAPNGVLEILQLDQANSGLAVVPGVLNSDPSFSSLNPVSEGSYVVISDNSGFPQYNGTVFRVGQEVGAPSGSGSNGNGKYWAVSEMHNPPSQQPWNINTPKDILSNHFSANGIKTLVIGRGVDPADASQHSDSTRANMTPALLPRTGPTQELGFISTSIVFN